MTAIENFGKDANREKLSFPSLQQNDELDYYYVMQISSNKL